MHPRSVPAPNPTASPRAVRFHDPEQQRRYDQDGLVVVDLLTPAEAERLRRRAEAVVAAGEGFSTSMTGREAAENGAISDELIAAVGPAIDRIVSGYEFLGAAYLDKLPGDGGHVPVHQDWTAVDERETSSMNIWCALVDVEERDAPIEALLGSHRWFRTYRSPVVASTDVDVAQLPAGTLVRVPVRAGQAVVYDHRLFHGSRPRTGTGRRPVAQLSVVPAGATVLTCVPAGSEGAIELREVEGAIFRRAFESPSPFDSAPGTLWATVRPDRITAADVVTRARGVAAGPPSRRATGGSGGRPLLRFLRRFGGRRDIASP